MNESITIPTVTGENYDYRIDWGDGSSGLNEGRHTYANPGIHKIVIKGRFPRISFNNRGDKSKILTIEQWGKIKWTSMERAFYGCENLQGNFVDAPDLSIVRDMTLMFTGASTFNYPIGDWDISNIRIMSVTFSSAMAFNQDISNWDTSNVTIMSGMFRGATSFNQPLGNWNVSKVIKMNNMFGRATSFNQSLENWDVSRVTTTDGMFDAATSFNQDISLWNTANIENMSSMFRNAAVFNQDISGWDITKVRRMGRMLDGTNLSIENYNALLIGWNQLNVQSNVTLGVGTTQYCSAEAQAARNNLITAKNWTIIDGGACGTLSISDVEKDKVLIYPNPTSDYIEIKNLNLDQGTITIVDMSGKIIQSKKITENATKARLDLPVVTAGIYIVQIKSLQGSNNYKLIIK